MSYIRNTIDMTQFLMVTNGLVQTIHLEVLYIMSLYKFISQNI